MNAKKKMAALEAAKLRDWERTSAEIAFRFTAGYGPVWRGRNMRVLRCDVARRSVCRHDTRA